MGNTLKVCQWISLHWDHPHIHGEHWRSFCSSWKSCRITPTYMGNTISPVRKITQLRDHPHIHGEHYFYQLMLVFVTGSPPHTWGTLPKLIAYHNTHRITPTYMGNTYEVNPLDQQARDHPHIHGEHLHIS